MEIKNHVKSNFGMIILSISFIIGCTILIQKKETYHASPSVAQGGESSLKLKGDIAGILIPLDIHSNSNDVSYTTKLDIGEGEKLYISWKTEPRKKLKVKTLSPNIFMYQSFLK